MFDFLETNSSIYGRYELTYPIEGIKPSCWNRPRLSPWLQTSTPFSPAKRMMVMPVTVPPEMVATPVAVIPFVVGVTLLIGTIVDELVRRRSRVHR